MASSAVPLSEALRTLEDMFADIDPRVREPSPGVRRPSDSGQGSRLPGARRLGGAALRPAVGFSV